MRWIRTRSHSVSSLGHYILPNPRRGQNGPANGIHTQRLTRTSQSLSASGDNFTQGTGSLGDAEIRLDNRLEITEHALQPLNASSRHIELEFLLLRQDFVYLGYNDLVWNGIPPEETQDICVGLLDAVFAVYKQKRSTESAIQSVSHSVPRILAQDINRALLTASDPGGTS